MVLVNIKATAPTKKPTKANQEIFSNTRKVYFSIPMATTPAADPMINILPPVPAE